MPRGAWSVKHDPAVLLRMLLPLAAAMFALMSAQSAQAAITNVAPPRVVGALKLNNQVVCDPGTWRGTGDAPLATRWEAVGDPPYTNPDGHRRPYHPVTQRDLDRGLRCVVIAEVGGERKEAASAVREANLPPSVAPARVAAGATHGCAVLVLGDLSCWGSNRNGQLGRGNTSETVVAHVYNAFTVAAGERHSCAVVSGGHVYCWGFNLYGQLGDGTTTDKDVAVHVAGLSGVTQISVGDRHTCAVTDTGRVWCWGHGAAGRLGNGGTADSTVPVRVSGISTAMAVAVGGRHACALRTDTRVTCWGAGADGRLGTGSLADSLVPVTIPGLWRVIHLTAGRSHVCAQRAYGDTQCWGANNRGQLGDGTTTPRDRPTPTALPALQFPPTEPLAPDLGSVDAARGLQLAAAGDSTCSRWGGGRILCWGAGAGGQTGDGVAADHLRPTFVPGLYPAIEIAVGGGQSCIADDNRTVHCWGGISPTPVPASVGNF